MVEVDSTYYSPPAEATATLWAQRTPDDFVFNIKAFSLLTGHPTKLSAIYKDLRPETDEEEPLPQRSAARRVRAGVGTVPVRAHAAVGSGQARRGAVPVPAVVHHPPVEQAVPARGGAAVQPAAGGDRAAAQVLVRGRQRAGDAGLPARARASVRLRRHAAGPQLLRSRRCSPRRRTSPWCGSTGTATSGRARTSTRSSATATAPEELQDWAPKLQTLSAQTKETHVLMNNCYSDYAQTNAEDLMATARRRLDPVRACTRYATAAWPVAPHRAR